MGATGVRLCVCGWVCWGEGEGGAVGMGRGETGGRGRALLVLGVACCGAANWRTLARAIGVPPSTCVCPCACRALGPILTQLATSPLRSGVEQGVDLVKGDFA